MEDPVLKHVLSSLPKDKLHSDRSSPDHCFIEEQILQALLSSPEGCLPLPLISCSSYHCQSNVSFFIWFLILSSYPVDFVIQPPDEKLQSCVRQSLWCVTQHFSKTSYLFSRKTMGRMTRSSWKWHPSHSVNKPKLAPAKVIRPDCWHTNAHLLLKEPCSQTLAEDKEWGYYAHSHAWLWQNRSLYHLVSLFIGVWMFSFQ